MLLLLSFVVIVAVVVIIVVIAAVAAAVVLCIHSVLRIRSSDNSGTFHSFIHSSRKVGLKSFKISLFRVFFDFNLDSNL